MSQNYIEDCFTITLDSDGKCTIDDSYESNENYLLLKELYGANKSDDIENYIKIYSQYINNKNIYNFHIYTDHPPSYCTQVFYPLCICENKNEENLIKIHKGRYEHSCNCVAGKRYLALRNAYEIEFKKQFHDKTKGTLITCSIADLFEHYKCDPNTFAKSEIIKYIESTGDIDFKYTEWIWN